MESCGSRCKAFISAARLGSYAEAAKELGYSVSSVSRMVSEMERSLGTRLLEKGQYGVRLTPQGAVLLPHANRLVSELARFDSVAREISEGEVGTIRIASVSSVATEILPTLMKAYASEHPKATFEIVPGDYRQIEEMLSEGRVDFGTLRVPTASGFSTLPILRDELVGIVSANSHLSSRDSMVAEDFSRYPFIALERPDLMLSEIEGWVSMSGLTVEPSVSVWDDNAALAMVEAGLGLTILPETVIGRTRFSVSVIPLEPSFSRRIDLAWRDETSMSAASKGFLEFVEDKLRNRTL